MRISDWSSDVCSSDLRRTRRYASRCSREEQAVSVALKWPRSCLMIAIFIDERGRSVQPKGPQRRDRHRHLISKAACHLNSARWLRIERPSSCRVGIPVGREIDAARLWLPRAEERRVGKEGGSEVRLR